MISTTDLECNDRRKIIQATAGLKAIPVLAVHWINGDCQLCGIFTNPNICQLPSGEHIQLCDECVQQIWNRCSEPEEKDHRPAST